jgi:hypothetical protein
MAAVYAELIERMSAHLPTDDAVVGDLLLTARRAAQLGIDAGRRTEHLCKELLQA